MIDYSFFGTYNQEAIKIILKKIQGTFHISKNEKGWEKAVIYSNGKGIKIFTQNNKDGECYKLFLAFSPHKQFNDNLHNANYITLEQAKNQIKKTFSSVGISFNLFKEFYISSIEIGINFYVEHDPYFILNSALMFGTNFFVTHEKYKHYKYASNAGAAKYLKTKFYIKSEQRNNDSDYKYFELRYCPANIMRFEIKLQRAKKFKFMDFSNMECLYAEDAEEILSVQLTKEFNKMFFFSVKHISKNNLTKPQQKKYYQYQVKGYWENLNTRKLNQEKKYYNEGMPKLINLQKDLAILIWTHLELKNYVGIPNETEPNNMSEFLSKSLRIYKAENPIAIKDKSTFCLSCSYIDIGIPTKLSVSENQRKRLCSVTGLDISMQAEEGQQYLKRFGLRHLHKTNKKRFTQLKRRFVNQKYWNSSLNKIIREMEHNIRHTHDNIKYNQINFVARNYHPDQLQLQF